MYLKKIICLLFLISVSCKDKNSVKHEEETIINSNNMIEDILKAQLSQGANQYIAEAGVEMPKQKFDISELNVIIEKCEEILISNGFKTINEIDFEDRIHKFFGRKIDPTSDKSYLYINNFDKCDKEFNYHPFHSVDNNGMYIAKKERFITEFYFIPEIIDYKKEFPLISKMEDSTKINYIDKDNNEIVVELWKDIKDLAKQRNKNKLTLVNRNKYLFNDSNASFTWLKINDPFFLETLVKTFGYYEDKALCKFVLNRSLTDSEEFGKVLWNKDCQDKLTFNEEIFSIIKALSQEEQMPYFNRISNYFEYLLVDGLNQEMAEIDLTFSQKTEMLAKLAYYATKATGTEGAYYYSFFNFLNLEEFTNEFEKQNYYNLKDFKTLFEETKSGGVGLPM